MRILPTSQFRSLLLAPTYCSSHRFYAFNHAEFWRELVIDRTTYRHTLLSVTYTDRFICGEFDLERTIERSLFGFGIKHLSPDEPPQLYE